jgi:PST family polysaccharide transporter
MRWGLVSAICQIIALFVGLPFGVFGVATAYAVAVFFLFLPALAYAGQPLGIKTSDVVRVVGPQMTASLVAVACAGSIQYAWLGEYPQIARVAISTVVCVGVYVLVVIGAFKLTQPIRIALSLGRDFRPTSTLRLRSSTFKA